MSLIGWKFWEFHLQITSSNFIVLIDCILFLYILNKTEIISWHFLTLSKLVSFSVRGQEHVDALVAPCHFSPSLLTLPYITFSPHAWMV